MKNAQQVQRIGNGWIAAAVEHRLRQREGLFALRQGGAILSCLVESDRLVVGR
ncbi:hypothetical protein STIAU_4910, partial [Stigmatella aurantiaca DW4/3-1]